MLRACHGAMTSLRDLGIGDGAALTCVRLPGVALGSGRYALTSRSLGAGDDPLGAAKAEYGDEASTADFGGTQWAGRGGPLIACLKALAASGRRLAKGAERGRAGLGRTGGAWAAGGRRLAKGVRAQARGTQ